MDAALKVAITGATGFVGSHLLDRVLGAGHQVHALTRRDQPPREGVQWVAGDLENRAALQRLVEGADAVVHVAGTINARTAEAFDKGNVDGTLAMLAAATAGGVHRFIQVSSLAAREPSLSLYGGSKARAEALVERSGLDWTIVRPPAVYGPGDKETLELFRMARGGQIFMPPAGRLSLIHVDDLARLLVRLAEPGLPPHTIIEPDDGRPKGWTHREFGAALGEAVGMPARTVSTPAFLLRAAARLDQLFRGSKAKLTVDRAAYFSHRDWVVDPERACPSDLWRPQIETRNGLRQTADWYRAMGWL